MVRVDFPETELLLVQAEERWRRWMDLYVFLSFVDGFMVNQLEVSYENSGFTHEISMVIIQLIIDILISLDWCKRKLTGNHIYFLR